MSPGPLNSPRIVLADLRQAAGFRGGHVRAATLQESLRAHKLGSVQGGGGGAMFADGS